jgi:hypothetical protein
MKHNITPFVTAYAARLGNQPLNTFALAEAAAAELGESSREDFCRLVNECEDAINALTGYVSPFAHLDDTGTWSPVEAQK